MFLATEERVNHRLKSIDFARTISILMVLTHHFGISRDPSNLSVVYVMFMDFMAAFGRHGAYGVFTFFIVSGFLIARITDLRYGSLFDIDVRDFYVRRIARIWPLLFLVIAIDLFLVYFANSHNLGGVRAIDQILTPKPSLYDPTFFVSILTFTTNVLLQVRFNEYGLVWIILWSLAVEEQFYLCFPWLCRWTRSIKNMTSILVIVFLSGMLCRAVAHSASGLTAGLLHSFCHFDLLALGIGLFLVNEIFAERLKARQGLASVLALSGFVVAAATYYFAKESILLHYVFAQSVFGLSVFCFLLGALNLNAFSRLPSIAVLPGFLSYGIYLYHPIVLLFVGVALSAERTFQFATYILVSVSIAGLSYLLYEKPFNKLIVRALGSSQKKPVPE